MMAKAWERVEKQKLSSAPKRISFHFSCVWLCQYEANSWLKVCCLTVNRWMDKQFYHAIECCFAGACWQAHPPSGKKWIHLRSNAHLYTLSRQRVPQFIVRNKSTLGKRPGGNLSCRSYYLPILINAFPVLGVFQRSAHSVAFQGTGDAFVELAALFQSLSLSTSPAKRIV